MKSLQHTGGLLIAFWGFILASCGEQSREQSYRAMLQGLLNHTVPEASIREAALDTVSIFLDARERKEFDVSHLKNSVWVGYKTFNLARLNGIDKNRKIIVYCSIGYRSEKIAEKLITAGYTSVSNLYGGIFGWANEGHPVYKSNKAVSEIHAYNHLWARWLKRGKKIYD